MVDNEALCKQMKPARISFSPVSRRLEKLPRVHQSSAPVPLTVDLVREQRIPRLHSFAPREDRSEHLDRFR